MKNPIRIFHNMVNITLGSQRDQMAFSRKKFSYLAITAGAVMLVMTFITPPAFAAEGGDSGQSTRFKALVAAGNENGWLGIGMGKSNSL